MREVRPEVEYQDAYHDGEQRFLISDRLDGFGGTICLSVGRSKDAAANKAIRTLRRMIREIEQDKVKSASCHPGYRHSHR